MSVQRFMVSRTVSNPEKNTSKTIASGGAITILGGYAIHTFFSSSNFILENSGPYSNGLEILIVGGGGGTGSYSGGAGGAEVVWIPSYKPGVGVYPVVVGVGGTGTTSQAWADTRHGTQSSVFGEYARGGGGGKSSDDVTPPNNGTIATVGNGGGGSSRSAGYSGTVGTFASASGIRYGGNRGGQLQSGNGSTNQGPNYPGAGGAGAGQSISLDSGATNGSAGGNGVQNSINGSALYWGGGGGGGTYYTGLGGAGGLGGGGGGSGGGGGGSGGASALNSGVSGSTSVGGNGGANTGGGGGAGRGELAAIGGSGGSGIVIIRYLI